MTITAAIAGAAEVVEREARVAGCAAMKIAGETGEHAGSPGATGSARADAPALPVSWRVAILVIAVVQFLVGHGAVWEHMFDWDDAILYSYASVPVMVLVALVIRRRLAFVPWLIHTLEVAGAKFALTASVLVVLLVSRHDPRQVPLPKKVEPAPAVVDTTPPARVARPPTVIAPETTGELRGTLITSDGQPVAGALVFVSGGLGDAVFAAPESPFAIENDGTHIAPVLSAVQLGQPVTARSRNGELHTLWLRPLDDVNAKLNVSVLGSGAPSRISFPDHFEGVATIECAVHRAREGKSHLGIFHHPFFTMTDDAGRFTITGVPAGDVAVSAFSPRLGRATERARVAARGSVTIGLVLATAAPN